MPYYAVNDRGLRIGEGHPRAVLSDADVAQLIEDRGPSDKPLMSYSVLAAKWGISKASVRDILKGRRRGQIGQKVKKTPTRRIEAKKARVTLSIPLHLRARLHRLGGSAWLVGVLESYSLSTHTDVHRAMCSPKHAHGAK